MDDGKPFVLLKDGTYRLVVQGATIVLPAIGALYMAVSVIWGFPAGEKVAGTIAAVNVFLGVLASLAKKIYDGTGAKYDGHVEVGVNPENGKTLYSLNMSGQAIQDIEKKKELILKMPPQ